MRRETDEIAFNTDIDSAPSNAQREAGQLRHGLDNTFAVRENQIYSAAQVDLQKGRQISNVVCPDENRGTLPQGWTPNDSRRSSKSHLT